MLFTASHISLIAWKARIWSDLIVAIGGVLVSRQVDTNIYARPIA